MKNKPKNKLLPVFATDAEAEEFVDSADLTQHDFSSFSKVRFRFGDTSNALDVPLPHELIEKVKSLAKDKGMSYQKLIQEILENQLILEGYSER